MLVRVKASLYSSIEVALQLPHNSSPSDTPIEDVDTTPLYRETRTLNSYANMYTYKQSTNQTRPERHKTKPNTEDQGTEHKSAWDADEPGSGPREHRGSSS